MPDLKLSARRVQKSDLTDLPATHLLQGSRWTMTYRPKECIGNRREKTLAKIPEESAV